MGMTEEMAAFKEKLKTEPEKEAEVVDAGELGQPFEEAGEQPPAEEVVEEEVKEVEVEEKEEVVSEGKLDNARKKFKDLDEAAKSYYLAEKKMHEKSAEASTERKLREYLELQLAAYRTPAMPPEAPAKLDKETISDKYYTRIQNVPETDPDRDRKVFSLMGDMADEIASVTTKRERNAATQQETAQSDVEERAVALGITEAEMDDFWIFAGHAPSNLSQEAAIQWTVDKVSAPKKRAAEEALSRSKKDAEELKKQSPLGRGSMKIDIHEEEAPLSLSEQLNQARRTRIYK